MPITNAHNNVRSLLLECAQRQCVSVLCVSRRACPATRIENEQRLALGPRPAAEPATRLQHGGVVWVLRCPHRVCV